MKKLGMAKGNAREERKQTEGENEGKKKNCLINGGEREGEDWRKGDERRREQSRAEQRREDNRREGEKRKKRRKEKR